MKALDKRWPWMILLNSETCNGKGEEILNTLIGIGKERCRDIRVERTEKFSAYSKEEGLAFQMAKLYLGFFFQVKEGNFYIRIITEIGADAGESIYFSFERGELGGCGYGTDWFLADYDEVMKYGFFKETYEWFVQEAVLRIQRDVPGCLRE